jgi:addiction module RelB/DinJ family antitoxin
MMGAVNVTIRVEEETKRQFDEFCDNVGMNMTTALTMFIKTVLRTRRLPFAVTDVAETEMRNEAMSILRQLQDQSVKNGTDNLTMEEIDAEIIAYRKEKAGR